MLWKFWRNRTENFGKNDCFMTSLHAIFGQNQPKIQTITTPLFFKQFRTFKRQKTQNVQRYKMAISNFQNFEFLTPKISKIKIFGKTLYKMKSFQYFQKTGIYVWEMGVDYIHSKFQVNRSTNGFRIVQKLCESHTPKIWNLIFGKTIQLRKIKMTPKDFPWNSASDGHLLKSNQSTSKFDLFWPEIDLKMTLTWPEVKMNITNVFYASNHPWNMCRMT